MSGSKTTGDRIFVIGNGPTMAGIDLSRLQDEDTLVFNDFTHRLDQLTPTYWMFFDSYFYRPYMRYIKEAQDKGVQLITISDMIPGAEVVSVYGDCSKMRKGKYEFYHKTNAPIPRLYSVGAIGYAGLQWAWQKGYREFYVIGYDSRDPRPKEHYSKWYCKDGGKKPQAFSSIPEDAWGKAYDLANKFIWENGGEIWDVSHSQSGSFGYKDLDEVIDG